MAVSLEEYFRTTFEDKLLVKMPEREDDHLTPATRLLEKRREMAEVEQALAAQKEEFQMKMESLQQRREELERKECLLKKNLLQFDKFLKDNDSKKARAVKKANDEREMKRQKEKEIEKLDIDTKELETNKKKLLRKLENYKVFHKYMEKTLERGEEFHEMRDVIARYDTLTATHEDLLKSEQKNQDVIEKHRQNLMKYIEEKDNEILSYNNQLSSLQTRLDVAQSEAVKWESQWTHIKNTAAKKTLELGRIKMATHNLYQLVKRHQRQAAQADETPEQLTQIQLFIQDLNQITNEIKRMELSGTSIIPPSSS
ncbi:coiled-coil domain-containing protein 42 homolog isoform X1 [Dreissena polymorpha]|uniref:coiled-coil domain-containing protein 42 homolog isoform X1 n=1 Tax=Dreissena polymorpha TaxID=45954 RepID=UPI002263DE0D|nr:coiled-coil domain-containing protein 42 homolog isoform X1 [Dreissena polymorpha]